MNGLRTAVIFDRFNSHMSNDGFAEVQRKLEAIASELKAATGPEQRRELLRVMSRDEYNRKRKNFAGLLHKDFINFSSVSCLSNKPAFGMIPGLHLSCPAAEFCNYLSLSNHR